MGKVGGEMGRKGARVKYIGGGRAVRPVFVYGLLRVMR